MIDKEYVTVLDKVYHKDCVKCNYCKQDLHEHCTSVGANLCHMECHLRSTYKVCSVCGDLILSDLIEHQGKTTHSSCSGGLNLKSV